MQTHQSSVTFYCFILLHKITVTKQTTDLLAWFLSVSDIKNKKALFLPFPKSPPPKENKQQPTHTLMHFTLCVFFSCSGDVHFPQTLKHRSNTTDQNKCIHHIIVHLQGQTLTLLFLNPKTLTQTENLSHRKFLTCQHPPEFQTSSDPWHINYNNKYLIIITTKPSIVLGHHHLTLQAVTASLPSVPWLVRASPGSLSVHALTENEQSPP